MIVNIDDRTVNITVGAIEVEPGKTYILETDQYLTDRVKDTLEWELFKQTGAYFIVLDGGIKIAKPEINC